MKVICFLLLFICSCCKAQYVVDNENDFNDVLQKIKAGETITWKNGIYQNLTINFKPTAKGTAQKRIYLKAQTPGKVILQGSSQLFISGEYLQVEGLLFTGPSTLDRGENVISFTEMAGSNHQTSNSIVTNCAIVDYNIASDTLENKWVVFYGFKNELSYCSFNGKRNLGSTVVIVYQKPKNFKEGDTTCTSSYHHIYRNYFGPRTMPGDNDGEHIRIGDSKTSFTRGFNLTEWNYFEGHRNEPEVISNKSCFNTYRFNSFINCDGALVLRHGNSCLVYGNYFNGKESAASGGIRVIGEDHAVINNYLENLRGSSNNLLKAAISIMSGLEGTPINGYYQTKGVVVAANTISNSQTPCIVVGSRNARRKGVWMAPEGITLANNAILRPIGKKALFIGVPGVHYNVLQNNLVEGGNENLLPGFVDARKDGYETLFPIIKSKTEQLPFDLPVEEMFHFHSEWKLMKEDAGVKWK